MKMKNLIEELDLVIKKKDLSPEHAARYIGCSFKQVYRWLDGTSTPTLIYRKAIRRGIERMKKLASVNLDNILEDRDLYKKISKKITYEEKIWLLDFDGDYSTYRERLKKLVKKYDISAKENKEK